MQVTDRLYDMAVYPRRENSLTHWIGGCVGPRDGLDTVVEKRQISVPLGKGTPVVQPVV
jgi:hypothetical protein